MFVTTPLSSLLSPTYYIIINLCGLWQLIKLSHELKLHVAKVPTLHLLDFNQPFVVETNASSLPVGAVLSQKNHPLSFFNRKMCSRLQASSVYVREMYAITEAIKKWRQYLLGQHFKIFTNKKKVSIHYFHRQFKCQNNENEQQNYKGVFSNFIPTWNTRCNCRCSILLRNANPFITACIVFADSLVVSRVTRVLQNLGRCLVNPILHSWSTTPQFVLSPQWNVVFSTPIVPPSVQ